MDDIKVSLNQFSYESKPKGSDIPMLSNMIGCDSKKISRDKIEAFVRLVATKGRTFAPATFRKGVRCQENFEQMQMLALDFDKGIKFDAVKERAKNYELPMLFAYETFSSTEKDKFRAVFLNDVSVPEPRVAKAMLQALTTIFPEADPSSKDISKMYFGGKELLHFSEHIPQINIELLFRNMTMYLKDKYGATNYKRKIAEFSRKSGIALNKKNLLDVKVAENVGEYSNNKSSPNSTISINTSGDNLLNKSYLINFGGSCTDASASNKKSNIHLPFRSSALNEINSRCKLFNEFISGSRILHHDELFGLATNLIQIESGAAKFKETLQANSYFDDRVQKYEAWNHHLSYIKDSYKPFSCDGFCSYKDECSHGTNILSTSKVAYHKIEKLANYAENYVPIEEAEQDFKNKLMKAVNSGDTMWHIIKAQTALGKTQTYLELLKNTQLRILIAVPTIILKHEVRLRAEAMGAEMIESPSLHEFKEELPDDVWSRIERLYNSGRSVIPYLKKEITEDNPECAAVFKKYLRELEEFNQYDGHAITTHKRMLDMDVSKYDLVIVDEDVIFNSIIPGKLDIKLSDLKRIIKKMPPGSDISKKAKQALKCSKTNELFTLRKVEYNKADDGKPMGVDLPSFCLATHFCYHERSNEEEGCISFMKPVKFNKNTKYIMVSATVDERICEYFFGTNNVRFCECKRARYEGVLNQYYDKSMSRACINKDASVIPKIKEWSDFEHTICFKKYGLSHLHYGNTEGCDTMKGRNIDVIGTPHQPEWIYKLFAYSIGLDFDADEKIKAGIIVDHNGYRFRFTTYDEKVLRDIQFYMLESELEQAVGRARLLRFDCVVNLFSNFPLRQASLKESEYDKESAKD